MSLKRARQGSTTAEAGKEECVEHFVLIEAGTSATVRSENGAGRTDSYYEWEKTANNGFKRRIIGAKAWTVCIL